MSRDREPRGVDNSLMPRDERAEEAVIGSLLLDRDAIVKVAPFLKAEDFYRERLGWVYAAILDLYERREPPDPVTLTAELEKREQLDKVGGYFYIVNLINAVPTAVHIEHYAHIVANKAIRRRLIQKGGEIAAQGYDESIPDSELLAKASEKLVEVGRNSAVGFEPVGLIIDRELTRQEERAEAVARGEIVERAISTGWGNIDRRLGGGLERGTLTIPAARPGVGKSSIALCMARNAIRRSGARVAYWSGEMVKPRLLNRLYAVETGIPSMDIRQDRLTDEQSTTLAEAQGTIAEWPFWIDDRSGLTINDIIASVNRLAAEYGLDILIVDYLQLVRGVQYINNRVQEVGEVARKLHDLAAALNIAVIAPAQISRAGESRQGNVPRISDLRESGDIEAAADNILIIHRPEMYEATAANRHLAEIHFGKNREGETGMEELRFNDALTRFDAWAEEGRDYDEGHANTNQVRNPEPLRVIREGRGGPREGGIEGERGGPTVEVDFSQYDD